MRTHQHTTGQRFICAVVLVWWVGLIFVVRRLPWSKNEQDFDSLVDALFLVACLVLAVGSVVAVVMFLRYF